MSRSRDVLGRLLGNFAADDRATARSSHEGQRRVEGKFQKLRRSPYKLFRATNPTFIADLESLPEFWRMPAHEISGALLGDAHPENLGAVGGSAATAQVDCTDFDVVSSGPLARDLARAACGLALAEDQRLPHDKGDERELAHALDRAPSEHAQDRVRLLATTWAERLLVGHGGLPDAAAFADNLAAVDTPIEKVALDESTHVATDHPRPEAIAAALPSYEATTPAVQGARLLRAWLLHGKGASSFCVDRAILELELAGGARCIVEWKPQPDAPSVYQAFEERRHPATRDPFLGLASVAGVGHVAQRWLVDAQKVKSKDLHGQYADDVARLLAVRLADLHRRLTPAIVERVRGQGIPTIADALADVVSAYLPVLAAEWRAFLDVPAAELVRRLVA